MKTQISRNSHQPDKGYNGVYQQQGRMLTDADWNELTDIQKVRLVAALKDAITSGSPREEGLKINPDGTIQPGSLYVDGWPALLDGDVPVQVIDQTDYPKPPTFSGKNLRFYADVWERTVTALEDLDLLDPALHGADTCTRMHTMLQVKWCNVSKQPENPLQNPPIGTGELKLRLRQILLAEDVCDPCATQLELDQRVGNYLFRVEVHDHYRQGGKEFLVIKWSRDNGSEQYKTEPVDELPDDFTSGDWVWEFFDLETEKLLGRHYPQSYRPKRGELVSPFAVPGGNKAKDFVRQCDGYSIINLTDGLLTGGVDKGTTLDPALGPEAHGYVDLNSGILRINLELMELELDLDGKQFVAGDYWLAEVREAVDNSGDYVLGDASQGEAPAGILHHYLELGQLDNTGALVSLTDEERRRLNFPPLTDIRAMDVGFTDNCPGLYAGAENVQQALDNLCAIGAEDIDYQSPNCPDSVQALLQAAISAWPDLDSDGKTSVKDMLDALLCHLSAESLPYNVPSCGDENSPTVRSLMPLTAGASDTAKVLDALLCNLDAGKIPLNKEGSICTELDAQEIQTVQDALQRLCLKSRGDCAVSVDPGELQDQLVAFAESEAEDIWLCLQPGNHVIDKDLTVTGKRSIKVIGSGEQASIIQFNKQLLSLEAREIHIEDLTMVYGNPSGQLMMMGEFISVEHNGFKRFGNSSVMPPMIQLDNLQSSVGEVYWNDNRLTSTWQHLADGAVIDELAPVVVVGPSVNAGLHAIVEDSQLLYEKEAYVMAVEELAEQIVALDPETRTTWRTTGLDVLNRVDYSAVNTSRVSEIRPTISLASRHPVTADTTETIDASSRALIAMENLTDANITVESAAADINDLVNQLIVAGYNPALAISSHRMGGRLEGNIMVGEFWLLNDTTDKVDPIEQKINQIAIDGELVEVGADLHLHNNRIHRMVSYMESGLVSNGELENRVKGYRSVTVSSNLFMDVGQSLIGGQISFQGNQFLADPSEKLGLLISNWITLVGNIGTNNDSLIQSASRWFAESGNLLNIDRL